MMRRLLIANRGEITCRIARTAHRLGIETVGVYEEADAQALHVDVVDRAVALGGSTTAASYLDGDKIVAVAQQMGCDAVHPGYGFLAENAHFARSVIEAGLVWVGPTPENMALLGDKLAAKRAAAEAGVGSVPAVEVSPGETPTGLTYPVIIKASAGGGGRGMRVVYSSDDLADAVAAASREAEAAFGDGSVFIERLLERGRHVEVQVIGDRHGTIVHLGERDCSIQRRSQKIIEESPSAGISDATRSQLCSNAVALARHVGYENAGTVEFLVGDDGTISFLEVNTRLQVEHPVTEAVTGLDIVELQLRAAAGQALGLVQDEIRFDGHAIEVRVVAEDPRRGWLPSTGIIREFAIDGDVRVDTGIREGSLISPEYDSLLAKVIVHAPTRQEAASRLRRALRTARVSGVDTNLAMLAATLGDQSFLAADTHTSYLADHPEVETATGPEGDERLALLLGAVFVTELLGRRADSVTGFAPSGWRNLRTVGQRQLWTDGDQPHPLEYVWIDADRAEVRPGPWPEPLEDGTMPDDERAVRSVRILDRSEHSCVIEIDGVRQRVRVQAFDSGAETSSAAGRVTWSRPPRFEIHRADEVGRGPVSPLPGTVIAVHVDAGQTVAEGDVLMVVEAMKMEHTITANAPATVLAVHYAVGDRVDTGDLLVELQRT